MHDEYRAADYKMMNRLDLVSGCVSTICRLREERSKYNTTHYSKLAIIRPRLQNLQLQTRSEVLAHEIPLRCSTLTIEY
jgi:hypothetical protein